MNNQLDKNPYDGILEDILFIKKADKYYLSKKGKLIMYLLSVALFLSFLGKKIRANFH